MYKLITLVGGLLISACTEEKKTQQVIIPEAQLQALQKAKNLQTDLLKTQEKQKQAHKELGL